MKRLYALILALALCLSLAACGGANTETEAVTKGVSRGSSDSAGYQPLSRAEMLELRDFISGTEQLIDWSSYEGSGVDVEALADSSVRFGCFLTSEYDDVRGMDLGAFLTYCAAGEELEAGVDDAEFKAYTRAAGLSKDKYWASLFDAPLPVRRYRVSRLNSLLRVYAGITIDDLWGNWKSKLVYLPEYDAFYDTSSDVYIMDFAPTYGEKKGDIVKLYEESSEGHVLTLRNVGKSWWHVVAYTRQ